MTEIKFIYWFASYNLISPSTRYRGLYPLQFLRDQRGIESALIYPEWGYKNVLRFSKYYLEALLFRKNNSLIVIQKVHTNRLFANLLKLLVLLRREHTLYDIDDAEYLRFPTGTMHFFMRRCSAVSTGSQLLLNYASQFQDQVVFATSPVPCHLPQFSKTPRKRNGDVLTVGWVGDYGDGNERETDFSHKKSLQELLFPALKQLTFPIKLVLIGVKRKEDIPELQNYFVPFDNIELVIPENLNWASDLWVYNMIREFDVGVSPMLDHEFNHAKSAFKIKQYLGCGVPALASEVGENPLFVKHNKNGFICRTTADFKHYLEEVWRMNSTNYEEMSFRALDTLDKFSVSNYCGSLLKVVTQLEPKDPRVAS